MQKDTHFYLTYALAVKAGIAASVAEKIAWANYYTDKLIEPGLDGMFTQTISRWRQKKVQREVLIPFHFLPGEDEKQPWVVTADSWMARALVTFAASDNPIRFGIALHAYQDSFSHQGFTGWRDDFNSCWLWWDLRSIMPNVAHTEMGPIPDIATAVWTDPRTGKTIDNRKRVMACARGTYGFLCAFGNSGTWPHWYRIGFRLWRILRIKNYDKRKDALRKWAGRPDLSYTTLDKQVTRPQRMRFVDAARAHRVDAMKMFPKEK